MPGNQPYISHTRPYQWVLVIIAVVMVSNLIHWSINRHLNKTHIQAFENVQQQATLLKQENSQLLEQNQQLSVQVQNQTQLLAVNEATTQQLRTDMQGLHEKNMVLAKELQFYQNITQGNASSKLQVRELEIRAAETPNQFFYRIVITQGKKISKPMTGDIEVSLSLSDASSRKVNTHALNLRHVQVIEGSMSLNENEQVEQVFIELKQGKKSLTSNSFPWEITPTVAM